MRTAQQTKNLSDWLNIYWPAIPAEKVAQGLNSWSNDYGDCGTVCCLGGWVALNPEAQDQGVFARSCGSPGMIVKGMGGTLNSWETAQEFFGMEDIFDPRSYNSNHIDVLLSRDAFEHEVVTNRLRWVLDHPEATSLLVL